MKRGQITIFIIIGIIILFIFGIIITIFKEKTPEFDNVLEKQITQEVELYVESLLNQITIYSIQEISKQGGLFNPETNYQIKKMDGKDVRVGLGLYDNVNYLSNRNIENELCKSVVNKLNLKLDFSFLSYREVDYELGEMSCIATITNQTTTVEVNYPITLNKKDKSKIITSFKTDVKVNFGEIISITNEVINFINSGNNNIETLDYSYNNIKVCYNGNNVLRAINYDKWEDQYGLLFQILVMKNLPVKCTNY